MPKNNKTAKIKTKDIPSADLIILDHIEEIVAISKKFGIDKCLTRGKRHLDYITDRLGINPMQAVLFSLFMGRSSDSYIYLNEIAEDAKCSQVKIIKYLNECDELAKKKLIRFNKDRQKISFRVPRDVLNSLRKFNEFRPTRNENLSISKLFTVFETFFEEMQDDEIKKESLAEELLELINQNMHLSFCKKIMNYELSEDNLILLICFCHLYINNDDDDIRIYNFEFLYDDKSESKRVGRELSRGNHPLMENKLVDFNNDNGFIESNSWKLSDLAKKELLTELDMKVKQINKKSLILFDTLKPKKMFYNSRETESIQQLTSLLQEENFRKILDRLESKGMRKGFACLFSGGPGTGKTETAYQIARETKRNIMMVDISQTKSMWYGESEKRIKAIFDNYRNAVEHLEIAPILLFNEADAVIGQRKEFNSSQGAVDQTENTIQNIILQEMENLSGILIATTNLLQNMDKAFERRFLYKINFDKPSAESRKGIWTSLLEDLSEDNAAELSDRFELSGGQIENVVRKINVDVILSGDNLSMDTLIRYCEDECKNGFNSTTKRLGFVS